MNLPETDDLDNEAPEPPDQSADKGHDSKDLGRLGIGHDPKGPFEAVLAPPYGEKAQMQNSADGDEKNSDKKGGKNDDPYEGDHQSEFTKNGPE